ncbi:GumC family protein [Mucilaginibacter sp. UYCu711]|uniref:GumC family protein n=1 Tax=Mucilaginibacter sp. UYCu711 TaxID=3156339 RepID=UPI003D23D1B1
MKLIRKPVKENEPVRVTEYLFKLIPYWPLFLCLALISISGTWLYLQFTTPLYQTTSRLLIRDDKKDNQDSKSMESLDVISPKRSVDNEVEVIKSRDLIRQVVNDLGLYAPIYQVGKLRDRLAYTSSPIVIKSNDTHGTKRSNKIKFYFDGKSVIIDQKKYPLNKLVITPYGDLKFEKNHHFTDTVNELKPVFYFNLIAPQKIEQAISSNLNVTVTNKLSTIIDLELKDENQVRGEDILSGIINFYNVAIEDEKNNLAAKTKKFISEGLDSIESQMAKIENQQQAYKANHSAVDIGRQGQLYLENVSSNDQKTSEISVQLSVLNQIEKYVRSKNLSNGIVPSTVGVNDPGLTQMVKNIYELQLEYEGMKKTAGENNPLVLSYKDQIAKIRPQILENLQNQKNILESSKKNILRTNQTYSAQIQTMPESEKKLVDINRELSLKSDIYTFLQQKKEQTALSFISNASNSKVIDLPESSELPVSPKGKIIYLGSLLVFFILGLGFVTAKESLRPNIMYYSEIENLTQLPVIGEITEGQKKQSIVINNNQRTLIAEQFRRLRTTLNYLGVGNEKKKILITSGISGEGKSFVAINLAMSLALTGKKVVLVDFDLNNPTLHTKLGLQKGSGVAEYLIGQEEFDAIIKQTSVNQSLYFISAGNIPDNPSELITSSKTKELLNYLDQEFDFIIVDVAPVGPISDAYIISPLCDATLYIIRHAYTPKSAVEKLDKNNIYNNLKNAAIVFNDVSLRNFSSYGYGYGYNNVYENKQDNRRTDI